MLELLKRGTATAGTLSWYYWNTMLVQLEREAGMKLVLLERDADTIGTWDWSTRT